MRKYFRNTASGKVGGIDGLNLFFGALLGANLGSIQGLALMDYFKIIVLLAGVAMVIRMLSTSRRRTYMMLNVGLYVVLVGAVLLWPPLQPKGVAVADLHRLAITLAVWVSLVGISELMPVHDDSQEEE